ncbi:MAG TPA: type II toxin-antitoxin system prevent-host-death family antitoxin [Solirubrobacteraceae bacterium]|jgi:prevent-host-death family protein|nr:type II toxin-antitoxin system prevent-host-death family antitoxin [Solirubrobacteraceae bacterium]
MAATHPSSKPATKTVGVRELRQNLSRYLERVKDGETLTVTERGREVARLVPSHPNVDPYYLKLAEKYGATIPKGNLVEAIERLDAEGRLGAGAPAGTTDAFLAESRREHF